MRGQGVTREAAGKRPATSSSGQRGALATRGGVAVGARHVMGVRVFVFDLIVLVPVLSVRVVLLIGAGASQTPPAVHTSHPEELVVAKPPTLLFLVLQAVMMMVEQMPGAVRPSFPVIVLGRHVVAQRQFLLAVHQYRARV